MSEVSALGAPAVVGPGTAPANAGALPAASAPLGHRIGAAADALTTLMAVELSNESNQIRAAVGDAKQRHAEAAELQKRMRDAMDRAQRASRRSRRWGRFRKAFTRIAQGAALVSAAAATVSSGGAAGPAALALAAVTVSWKGQWALEKMGVQEDVAFKVSLGVGIAASAGSAGWGIANAVRSASSTSAAVTEGSSQGIGRAIEGAAPTVRTAADGAGGVATVGSGTTRMGEAVYQQRVAHAEEARARADARHRHGQHELEAISSLVRELHETFQSAKDSILEAHQLRLQAASVAANFGRTAS